MGSGLDRHSRWREPLPADWRDRAAALQAALEAGSCDQTWAAASLRRLAAARLGPGERIKATRLARRARANGGLPAFRSLRVLLVSNRTTHFFAADLEAASPVRNLLIEPVELDYGAAVAVALNPAYPAPAGPFDAVLFMVDLGYFSGPASLLDPEADRQRQAEAIRRLEGACEALKARFAAPLVVATLALDIEFAPTSVERGLAGSAARLAAGLNQRIHEGGQRGEWIVWDIEGLAHRVGLADWFDPVRFHEAKTPFSFEASPIAADGLAALLAAMTGRSGRALALDLDNTLWGGVAADEGLEGIRLGGGSAEGEAFAAFQAFLLDMRARGLVLGVCSKNLDWIAREPFQRHPEMRLKENHIAAFVADFADKATNLVVLAEALDLDVSSLVFIDDNPAERERVRSALPFVLVPEIGEDPAGFARVLVESGYLEHLNLTREDAGRAEAYQGRSAAKAARTSIGAYDDYLLALGMELQISPFSAVDRARIVQLIQKSNQFNLTTKRYSEAETAAVEAAPDRLGWAIRLKDRFADHGLIGVVIADKGPTEWVIDSWIMSCRVLERGVEQAVMNELVRAAGEAGAAHVRGVYRPTARNGLVGDFFERMGFGTTSSNPEETRYSLAIADHAPQPVSLTISNTGQ